MNRIVDAFPNWLDGKGIFDELNKLDVPWTNDSIDLDLEYFGNHSGEKLSSPLVEKLSDNGVLSDVSRARLASVIFNLNHENWNRLYLALQKEYDPLQNYNGTETRTIDTDDTGTDRFEKTGTDSTSSISNGSNIKTGSERDESSGSDTIEKTGTDSLSVSGTDTNIKTGSENNQLSGSDVLSKSGTEKNNSTNSSSSSGNSESNNTNNKTSDETINEGVYGFNSSSSQPSQTSKTNSSENITEVNKIKDSSSNSGKNDSTITYDTDDTTQYGKTETHTFNSVTGTDTKSETSTTTYNTNDTTQYGKSDTHTYNSVTDTTSGSSNETLTHNTIDLETKNLHSKTVDSFHREGNLGVTTSQQMLESEFELRIKYRFFDVVFGDLDKTLALSIY